jgi:hypothetical protein
MEAKDWLLRMSGVPMVIMDVRRRYCLAGLGK